MSRDPWADPAMRAWARDVEARVVQAMRDSACVAPIWSGDVDANLAGEIGAAVLLDKPVVLVVMAGVRIPEKLVQVADRIVESSGLTTDEARRELSGRIAAALREVVYARQGGGGRA